MRKETGRKQQKGIKWIQKAGIALFWLLIWHCIALIVDSRVLVSSPADTLKALFRLLTERTFYFTVANSFFRIILGFLFALLAGCFLAVLSHISGIVRMFTEPVMKLIKAVPVASFIILVLLWVNAKQLSTVIAFVMVLPVFYINVLQGLSCADDKLLEMAQVFRLRLWKKVRYIYLPALMPHFVSAVSVGLGFCFKSGIAAEVIGLPNQTIGTRLYETKLYLMMDELLAWTAVIVCVSAGFEKLVTYLVRKLEKRVTTQGSHARTGLQEAAAQTGETVNEPIEIIGLSKSYPIAGTKEAQQILKELSFQLPPSSITCLMGASGAGKTTLLRILAGLETPDSGSVKGIREPVAYVFQEDRLIPMLSGAENVRLAGKTDGRRLAQAFAQLSMDSGTDKPVSEYSGGMMRRVAILRALFSESSLLLLDEPFTGLDDDIKKKTAELILEMTKGKTVLLVTHDKEEADLLGASVLMPWK